MSWRSFALTVDYRSGQTPDTALIVASASNANGLPTAEPSYIYLDNLSFKGNVDLMKTFLWLPVLMLILIASTGSSAQDPSADIYAQLPLYLLLIQL